MKEFELRGARSFSVKVPITPQYLREIANILKEHNGPDGQQLRITLQSPPALEKQYAAMGRVKDFVIDSCDAAANVKDFWNPDFEVFIEIEETESKVTPVHIASVLPGGHVKWIAENLKHISCRDVADADAKLGKFKRR